MARDFLRLAAGFFFAVEGLAGCAAGVPDDEPCVAPADEPCVEPDDDPGRGAVAVAAPGSGAPATVPAARLMSVRIELWCRKSSG